MGRPISPTENHLKAQLLNEFRRTKRISSSTVLANELPLGSTGVRADLVFYSRYLTGVEIKSDRDSLKRLARQLPVYRDHFDRTILVLGSKHWAEARNIDLNGVELWIASGMALKRVQRGVVARKLDNQENLLSTTIKRKYEKKAGSTLDQPNFFREAFFERFKATSEAFWLNTLERKIEADDLAILSRFIDKREQSAALVAMAKKAQKKWLEELTQSIHSSSVSKKDSSSPK